MEKKLKSEEISPDQNEDENLDKGEESAENDSLSLTRRLIKLLQETAMNMERFNLAEYVNLLNNPRRFLAINFFGGVARGLGFALGATVFAALLIYFLQQIMVLNLPLIGDFISDIVKIVQDRL